MTRVARNTKVEEKAMQKYIVTRESDYFESGFKVGDIVHVDGSSDPMRYGGFVYRADSPRPRDHKPGCYYHSPKWCRESLVPCTPENPPDMAELIESHAEFRRAGDWLYHGFFVGKDVWVERVGKRVPGWHVCGIDNFATGKATRPFKRMQDAFMWIESEYGDSHVT